MLTRLVAVLALVFAAAAHADTLSSAGSPSPASLFDIQPEFVTGVGDVTDFRWLPDGRLVVINKAGNVLVRPAGGGTLVDAGSFAVDTASEKGLLGIAVDPAFTTNRRLYFYYSAAGGTTANKHRVVVRTLGANSVLDPGETPILSGLRGPNNHDGGGIDIGPDGLLYVGVGDTGCNSNMVAEEEYTPTNFYGTCLADDPANLGGGNGKILRVALNGGIPPSNPLVGATNVTACGPTCGTAIDPGVLGDPRPEIFAWGFRNPFRLWVDPVTGRVWVGDVGEISYEEVTIVEPGRHHGWPWREGGRGHPGTACQAVRIGTGPSDEPILDQVCVEPVYFCGRSAGGGIDGGCQSITGGQIAESCTWPEAFRGRYVFADYVHGSVFTLVPNGTRDGIVGGRANFATIEGGPTALRVGNDGALYVAVYPAGRIARIAPTAPGACTTGCIADAECDDGNPCTADDCNELTIGCTHTPIAPCVPSTTTTTTASTTTLTTVTTTSTLPAECAGLIGPARARCEVDAARGAPVCGSGIIDARFGVKVETALARASALLSRATGSSRARKANALMRRADRRLKTVQQLADRALRRDQIDDTCHGQVDALITRLRAAASATRR